MKHLTSYLKEQFDPHNKNEFITSEYINALREYLKEYFGEINLDNLDLNLDLEKDYILENLNTHDTETLKSKIKSNFSNLNVKFEDYDGDKIKSFCVICSSNQEASDLVANEIFKNLIEFFNYVISEISGNRIFIEPVYSEDKTRYLLSKCKGICYHITTQDKVDSILENGLRIKTSRYRKFPSRIYVYATEQISLLKDKNIKNFCNKIVNKIKANKEGGLAILRINLNKLPDNVIKFYKDTSMKENEALFTYNNIPKECLSKINSLEFLK